MNKKAHLTGGFATGVLVTSIILPSFNSINKLSIISTTLILFTISYVLFKINIFNDKYKKIRIKHFTLSIVLVLILSILFPKAINIEQGIICALCLMIGSILGGLLPDIDHRGSTISKKFKILSYILNKFGHRGFTHAPLIYLLILSVNIIISNILLVETQTIKYEFIFIVTQIITGICIGALNHILLDSLTLTGVPLLYPLSSKKTHILRLRTGVHDWFGILISILMIVYVVVINTTLIEYIL